MINIKLSKIFENSPEAVILTDPQGKILEVNNSFCAISGYSPKETIGKNPKIMKSGRHDSDFYKKLWKALIKKGSWQGEIWDRRKNGEYYPKWLSINAIRDENNETEYYLGIFSDIITIKESDAIIKHLANFDILTNLPNRNLFHERLQKSIVKARRKKKIIALLIIDIDRFNNINETLGHQVGDKVLIKIARRLINSVRSGDTVSRIGGDEFTVILQDLDDIKDIPSIVQKIFNMFSEPFVIDTHEFIVNASIGISIFPLNAVDIKNLLRYADAAMSYVKNDGKNNYRFYSEKMEKNNLEKFTLENNLRRALQKKELLLHYQPQVDSRTKQIIGIEALIRWNHSSQGLILPGKFIPIMEETGLIFPIGEWVLRTACTQSRILQEKGLPPLRIAVNISGRQFKQQNLAEIIKQILKETSLNPACLELEITESVIMEKVEETKRILDELKKMGIFISIDDFGTGYSSLSYLKRFPIDRIKIDQSFIRDIDIDSDDSEIVKAIITLAHSLRMKVVAEGVENTKQLSFLQSQNCDEIQGYLFSKPVAFNDLIQVLKNKP